MLLPSIEFTEPVKVLPVAVSEMIAGPEITIKPEMIETQSGWVNVIPMIYLAGVLWMLFKFLEGIYRLKQLISQSQCIDLESFTLVLLPDNPGVATGSFSFFSYLIVSRNDYENHFETILQHEEVHIRQWHSIDIILIEILKIVCWFNPVLWLYKLALREIHEYLADEQAANRDSYATFLVLYAKNAAIRSISNQFYNSSLLKDRIKMIYKGRTSRWFRGKYLLLVPFVTVLVVITAARKQIVGNKKKQNTTVSTTSKSTSKKRKLVVAKEVNAKEITISGKKTRSKSKKSRSTEKDELLQFSNWTNSLAPKNPFAETGENQKFQNYASNYRMTDYSAIIPPRLTVIEPPKMKFHRYGLTIGRPVLRAVDMKYNVE
jgi:hypothetical protein